MRYWDTQVHYFLNMHYSKEATIILILFLLSIQCGMSQEVEEDLYESTVFGNEETIRDQNESEGMNYRKPLNINKASSQDLIKLGILNPEQIRQFILFRRTFGNFISLAELQAVPYWDLITIRQVIPLLNIEHSDQSPFSIKKTINNGEHTILYRTGGKITDTLSHSRVSDLRQKVKPRNNYAQLVSYRFSTSNQIQWGITMEKDAGEKIIFDHRSGYLMMSKKGIINRIIIGDFLVNMGQGVIHWQGHAFGRSSNIIQGLKQSELFKAHTGTDENIFHRGAAISLSKHQFEFSTFVSRLRIDANVITDDVNERRTVSSKLTTGLHRTEAELADKDALRETTAGGRLTWNTLKGKISMNHIRFNYDIPISKRNLPYNRFAILGNDWNNTSIDYSWSTPLGLLFGEVAIDKRMRTALIGGLIKSFDPKFDISLIVRNMSHDYKAIQSNTMTQQSEAGNERGIFSCFNLIISPKSRIEGFTDHYINSWPVYFNDGIRRGQSFAIQYLWKPDKKNELYLRWRSNQQTTNSEVESSRTNNLSAMTTHAIRLNASSTIGEVVTVRCRSEIIWLRNEDKINEQGLLSYAEIIIKPKRSSVSISGRYTLFETDSYGSRIYAYERDILSYHAIPAHYDNGNSAYLVIQYKLNKAVHISTKCVLTNREKNDPPYYASAYNRVKQFDWRIQLLWKIRS